MELSDIKANQNNFFDLGKIVVGVKQHLLDEGIIITQNSLAGNYQY